MPKRDVVIAIASRNNPQGLWMSCETCEIDAKQAGIDFGFAICTNGDGKLDPDTRQVIAMLKQANRLDWHEHFEEALTPQMARQKAIDNSDSEVILCVDNHVIICPNFFKRALLDFEKYNCDVLHSATRYYQDDFLCLGYKLALKKDFWGTSEALIDNPYKPFLVSAAGHGGVFFNRKSFSDLNGYYLSSSFKGYSGEELTCDLGAWLQGKKVWLDAQIEHRHWAASSRGYQRHKSEDFYTNLFSCAYILSDKTAEDYTFKMMEHFSKQSRPIITKTFYDLMMIAKERSQPYADWLRGRRNKTIEELLEYFRTEGIAH